MSPRYASNRRPGGRAQGRSPTAWAGFTSFDATVAAGTKQIIGSLLPLAGFSHETVVRIVGEWQKGGGVGGTVAIGACVITDAAFAVGAAAVPDPISDVNDDIWVFISSISEVVATDVPINRQFDSRAMRKVDEGSRLAFIIANNSTANASFGSYFRVLSKVAVRT